jgi:hypothetical protein
MGNRSNVTRPVAIPLNACISCLHHTLPPPSHSFISYITAILRVSHSVIYHLSFCNQYQFPQNPIHTSYIMSKSRVPLVLGLTAAGGVGYYLYGAGGNPKAAEKQLESTLAPFLLLSFLELAPASALLISQLFAPGLFSQSLY